MNAAATAQPIGQIHIPAAKLVKKLSKAQRVAIPYVPSGWIMAHPATIEVLIRLGIAKRAGAGRMRHHVLTVEGQKVQALIYGTHIEEAHAKASHLNAAD